jgi:hypothetical protein
MERPCRMFGTHVVECLIYSGLILAVFILVSWIVCLAHISIYLTIVVYVLKHFKFWHVNFKGDLSLEAEYFNLKGPFHSSLKQIYFDGCVVE